MQRSAKLLGLTILMLCLFSGVIWHAVAREGHAGRLTVTFLNIGQGDSIFIQAPSGRQMLIDGGANRAVLRELSTVMPWYDRTIDVVLATHPDADHIGGLPDVLARYKVGVIVQSSVTDEGGADSVALEKAVVEEEKSGAKRLTAMRGQIIDLGKGAYLEILFPDRPVPHIETNTGAVVARLAYGDTSFMLTGDSPKAIEDYLVKLDGDQLHSDILKAGHHGSRTSSGPLFVGFVGPSYAVFSRGCDNKYGHPHQEVIDLMAKFGIPTLDTCTEGAITFVSDGKTVVHK
jgi:competence protein ComEC